MSIHDRGMTPLPGFTDPRVALRKALLSLRPAELVSVTESAERYMRVKVGDQWQPFRRDVTPYMVEPTDQIASRDYRGLVFCGPSQSGKTQMLASALAYTIMSNPGRVALFQMTRDAAAEFERNKLAPLLRNSPDIRARLAKGRGSDNMYQKLFEGGTQLTLDWPTITKLSSATIRLVLGTDYDHFPESVDGEGDAYSLMRARARTFQSRGMVVVESSPAAPVVDESWRPTIAHDCPPVRYGVLALYPQGTRARWYWPCPHCEEEFEPTFNRIRYPDSDDPAESGEAAEMSCPHCGGIFGHGMKRELNIAGRWLHVTRDGAVAPLNPEVTRRTDMLSYWLDGAAAAFSTWADLVTQYRSAVQRFDATGDEEALKTATNTGLAHPYLPRSALTDGEVSLQGLKDKARGVDTPRSVCPDWTRYVTISVDVQGTRFVVGATAWGPGGQHQPIDRFDLAQPPASAPDPSSRTVRPFDVAEDWAVLNDLAQLQYPVQGTAFKVRPVALAVDMQGGGATTENAYAFYRGRRKAGEGRIWFLTRGRGGDQPNRVWLSAPERTNNAKRRVASDIKILHMATDRLKDAVMASLRLQEDGQNLCVIPEWMSDADLTELTAERRGAKGWEKRPGMVRNESLDHLVQARALHIQIGGEKLSPEHPAQWAVLGLENPHVSGAAATADAPAAPVNRPVARTWIEPKKGWL